MCKYYKRISVSVLTVMVHIFMLVTKGVFVAVSNFKDFLQNQDRKIEQPH
jgi:hypothetical protein